MHHLSTRSYTSFTHTSTHTFSHTPQHIPFHTHPFTHPSIYTSMRTYHKPLKTHLFAPCLPLNTPLTPKHFRNPQHTPFDPSPLPPYPQHTSVTKGFWIPSNALVWSCTPSVLRGWATLPSQTCSIGAFLGVSMRTTYLLDKNTVLTQTLNASYQHTSTHPVNTPYQSTYPINAHQHILSTYPLNTPTQPPLKHLTLVLIDSSLTATESSTTWTSSPVFHAHRKPTVCCSMNTWVKPRWSMTR